MYFWFPDLQISQSFWFQWLGNIKLHISHICLLILCRFFIWSIVKVNSFGVSVTLAINCDYPGVSCWRCPLLEYLTGNTTIMVEKNLVSTDKFTSNWRSLVYLYVCIEKFNCPYLLGKFILVPLHNHPTTFLVQ